MTVGRIIPLDLESSVDSRPREAEETTVLRFPAHQAARPVTFDRHELTQILNLYGRHVAEGEWRDYAMEFGKEAASFSIFRRASEVPIYRIEKDPRLARKQGAYSVIGASRQILRRGHDLDRVLLVIDRKLALV